ncbi:hypothetical protein [Microbacterium sp. NPDC057944]|uniref:hypothetical protein n=1 Tax=Microbacterium sp. NPDC057944 TaxID=3346286 RepID=UPI0036DB07BC
MKRPLGSWPLLSGPNKNGSRHIGIRVLPDAARQLEERGYIVANKMYERSVDRNAISNVRIGDVFDVRFDGDKGWWAWQDDVRLGCLTWSLSSFEAREWREAMPRIDEGTLQVIRLVLDATGIVVNAGGIVRPLGDPIPPVKKAVPDAQEYVPTLRAAVGVDGDVRVAKENVGGAPRVGQSPAPLPRSRKSIWERLTRH